MAKHLSDGEKTPRDGPGDAVKPSRPKAKSMTREERLAEALRQNLRRRKAPPATEKPTDKKD